MKSIKNEKLIKRNGKIANYAMLASFALMGVTVFLSIQGLSQANSPETSFRWLAGSMFVALILSQVGAYMSSRFGPSPRLDEKLDAALKGLQNEFVMYHYTAPVSHLLIGPAGVWVILPYPQAGRITFQKNRWRNSGGGFMQSYLRFFALGQGLGRPDIEAEDEVRSLHKYLSRKMDESDIPEINALMVFTNDNVELDAEDTPVPAMKVKQFKDFIRQKAKEKKFPAETLNQLKTIFG